MDHDIKNDEGTIIGRVELRQIDGGPQSQYFALDTHGNVIGSWGDMDFAVYNVHFSAERAAA